MTKKKDLNKLKITVSGLSGGGMSTLVHYIGSILAANGFNVDISSKDFNPNLQPLERFRKLNELLDRDTSIKLETKVAKGDLRNELLD